MWQPKEIVVHQLVQNDSVTQYLLSQCQTVPVRYVNSGRSQDVVKASKVLQQAGKSMLDKILAGKQVVFIAPAGC